MRKSLPILICCMAIACQNNAPSTRQTRVTNKIVPGDARNARVDDVIRPVPIYVDRSLLGTTVGADGNVGEEATTAKSGENVYLTMFLHDSPVGLKTQALWTDAVTKKEIHREEREMKGAKTVTFVLETKTLKPGRYHVRGYWGGNIAADKDFEIEGKAKK